MTTAGTSTATENGSSQSQTTSSSSKSGNGSNNQRGGNSNRRYGNNKGGNNFNRPREIPECLKPIFEKKNKLEKEIQSKKDTMARRKAERQACSDQLDELTKASSSSDEFKTILEEKKKVSKELQGYRENRSVLTNQIKEVQTRINQAGSIDRDVTVGRNKFRSLKEVEDKLKFLENQRYKTTSAREDEQILNEMAALEKAKDGFANYQAQQEALNQDRQLQKGIQAKLDALRAQMNPLTTKEKELQNKLDKASNRNGDVKTKLRAKKEELGKENNAEYEEIAALLTQLKELNVEEKETRTKWEADRKEAQEKKKLEEEQRKKDLIKKYEEEYLKKHPYEVEMKICDQLLIYVEALITDLNKSNDLEATNANSSSTTSMKTNKTGFFDSDNEEEVIGKKKKNKKNKARAVKAYALDIEMVPSFTRIKCEPPTKQEDFQKVLEKIKEKKEWYTSQPLPSKVEITLDDNEQPVVKYPDLPLEKSESSSNESNGESKSLSKSESQGSTGSKKSKKSAKLDVQSSEQFPSLGGN